jgi:hypothetical protein
MYCIYKKNNWIPPPQTTGIIFWDVRYSLLSTLSSVSPPLSLCAFQNAFKAREIERYGRVEMGEFDLIIFSPQVRGNMFFLPW